MIQCKRPKRALKTVALAALVGSILALAACGNRGPLYLPDQADSDARQQQDAAQRAADKENDEENSGT